MRLLLDSHALIWLLVGDDRLPRTMRSLIARSPSETYVSAASAWEITTKHRLGKLPDVAELAASFEATIVAEGFHPLAITMEHAAYAGRLQGVHKDPFDRMLIAQAILERMALISNETAFDRFAVTRLW